MRIRHFISRLLFAGTAMLPSSGYGTVFDWSEPYATEAEWKTPKLGASESVTYNNDPEVFSDAVTITVTNEAVQSWETKPGIASANAPFTGGNDPEVSKALQIAPLILDSKSAGITVTITFNYPRESYAVSGVQFSIYNIMKGERTAVLDQISGISTIGEAIYATTVKGSSANEVSGSESEYAVRGVSASNPDSADGNVSVTFESAGISRISFRWNDSENSGSKIGNGGFALSNISFTVTPTPEVGTGITSLAACAVVLGLRRRQRG